ncbi:hypothetical protein FHS85_003035 [Rhodoligotrophos appendicifer]|uniref:hypothetical protein n=1 Tax=Rhodoligotrophos appendicifer TaxID=987056 RepID=UPI00118570C8|nr:hypothetical protein [Rhodoligotrophos appendicifer]
MALLKRIVLEKVPSHWNRMSRIAFSPSVPVDLLMGDSGSQGLLHASSEQEAAMGDECEY